MGVHSDCQVFYDREQLWISAKKGRSVSIFSKCLQGEAAVGLAETYTQPNNGGKACKVTEGFQGDIDIKTILNKYTF